MKRADHLNTCIQVNLPTARAWHWAVQMEGCWMKPRRVLHAQSDDAVLIASAKREGPAGEAQRDELLHVHAARIWYILRRFRARPDQYDDALQAARMAFLEALVRYDPARGATLWTFARPFVLGEVRRIVTADWVSRRPETYQPQSSRFVTLEECAPQYEAITDPGFALVEDRATIVALHEFVRRLPPGQRDVVVRYFWQGASCADIARARHTSRAVVTQQLAAVYRKGKEVLAAFEPKLDAA
jgi:RNA polymerase sigma factor (sigma-70 family)